jgi:membrane protein YdbS with pleckstrin-like domain
LANIIIDLFEVAILLGSCFLINYVTADSKTNWAEGVALVVLYIMIVSLFFIPQFCLSTLAFRHFAHGSTPDSQKSNSCLNAGVSLQRSRLQRLVTRLGTQ